MRKRPSVVMIAVTLAVLLAAIWYLITQPISSASRMPAAGADPARLAREVKALTTTFSPRDSTHPKNLDRAASHIAEALRAAGGEVTDQPFNVGERRYRNVLARFGPDSPTRLVVGAHYDAFGELPGADDNASGVAGLLELGRLLGAARLYSRVELAAYSLEEPPFFGSDTMGSAVHARFLNDAGVKVKAMLCLEMIGFFSDAPDSQTFPLSALRVFYPSRGDFIAVVGRFREIGLVRSVKRSMRSAGGVPVVSMNAPEGFPAIDLSDHASFWRADIPAVMITDTSYYRNPHYHRREDTADTLDYTRMAGVVEGVLRAVLDLAGS